MKSTVQMRLLQSKISKILLSWASNLKEFSQNLKKKVEVTRQVASKI
jgi:hypothetical protein